MTRPAEAVSAALTWNGRILLVRRAREPARGMFALPGGRLEPGETPEAAVRREVLEETGLRPLGLSLLATIEPADAGGEFRIHVFAGHMPGGEPVPGDDADHAAWYRLDELAHLPVTRSSLEMARRVLAAAGEGAR